VIVEPVASAEASHYFWTSSANHWLSALRVTLQMPHSNWTTGLPTSSL